MQVEATSPSHPNCYIGAPPVVQTLDKEADLEQGEMKGLAVRWTAPCFHHDSTSRKGIREPLRSEVVYLNYIN